MQRREWLAQLTSGRFVTTPTCHAAPLPPRVGIKSAEEEHLCPPAQSGTDKPFINWTIRFSTSCFDSGINW
jgi:hypothetical protein